MNQVMQFNNPETTMSSLDFMEIVNRYRSEAGQVPHEPRKFLAKLEDELDDLTGKKFRLNNNQTKTAYYELNFDQMMLVGMREAKIVRRNVLAKLKELEANTALPNFANPAEAARAWAEQFEQKQAALQQLEAAKPAVEFVGRYVESTGNKGFRQVAKLLKANERELRQFLSDHKIMYRLGGEWAPYQPHIDAGRFVVKTGVADNEHAYNAAKFTPKGIAWLAEKWASYAQEVAA